MSEVIRIGSDNLFEISGLRKNPEQTFVNDATVLLTLLESRDGAELTGQSWPLTLDYVASSNGVYRGTIQDAVVAVDNQLAVAKLEIDGDGLQLLMYLDVVFDTAEDPSLAWTSRKEIERVYGVESPKQWADLDGDQDADKIDEVIQNVVLDATEDARDRLSGAPCGVISSAPRVLRRHVSMLAGVMLYDARGTVDATDEEGRNRLSHNRKLVERFFRQALSGQRRLQGGGNVTYPMYVDDASVPTSATCLENPLNQASTDYYLG